MVSNETGQILLIFVDQHLDPNDINEYEFTRYFKNQTYYYRKDKFIKTIHKQTNFGQWPNS